MNSVRYVAVLKKKMLPEFQARNLSRMHFLPSVSTISAAAAV